MKQSTSSTVRRWFNRAAYAIISCAVLTATPGIAVAQSMQSSSMQRVFAEAADQYGVPKDLLLAIAYDQTHWENNTGGRPSINGGFGPLNLTVEGAAEKAGRGDARDSVARPNIQRATLTEAAKVSGQSADSLKTDPAANVRGGAALLATYAKELNNGKLPSNIEDWYSAVAKLSGTPIQSSATLYADSVFGILQKGASTTTTSGQALSLPATPHIKGNKSKLQQLRLDASLGTTNTPTPECPPTLSCTFVPAYYGSNNPNDATDYGNYDYANRPTDMPIKYIYIHDTEGSYDSSVAWFQNPASYVSAQYIVNTDGSITQMVRNKDVSWAVGDWYLNPIGINIEHVGYAATGSSWYTPQMYKASATLVKWLAQKYNISTDRSHIIGHDEAPALSPTRMATQHADPGPFWNWNYYMGLIHGVSETVEPSVAAAKNAITTLNQAKDIKARYNRDARVVAISPNFAANQPPVTTCQNGICTPLPAQGANFVYLRTEPRASAPLLSDKYLHTDNAAGTTNDSDWGDKAVTGARYVVAGQQSGWTGIYYGGQVGWFYNPGEQNIAPASSGLVITPKAGVSSVNVYGGAYPEASAYPSDVPVQNLSPLYTISAGQSYVSSGLTPAIYFYDWTWNYSAPNDHAVVIGGQKYYAIMFNHRIGFVRADDVAVSFTLR